AGSQDLEILHRAAGAVPRSIFDTQIAAGFLGMRTPSLSSLHENLLGVKLTKGDRLTDWLQRPLKESQLQYAASDVRYLLELHQVLTERLIKLKRYEWAEAEFITFLEKRQKLIDPKDAWQRIKEAKHLNKQARGVAQALAEWRELAAQKNDIPNRYIMSDLALVGIAQRKPTKLSDLKNIRGFDYAQYQKEKGQHLLKIVEKGLKADPVPSLKSRKKSLPPEMRPAITLLSAWLAQFATDQNIDPALLGSRSDIEELLRGESDSRLQVGWRHEEVGEQVDNLLQGKSSLSFENGRLVIESRGTHA
ncbi:MAG: HRDC domain-containing protein, partial [Actinomycetota bacterium]|nr:HRDC domain-containing protein [Actinomycetota bacterium]